MFIMLNSAHFKMLQEPSGFEYNWTMKVKHDEGHLNISEDHNAQGMKLWANTIIGYWWTKVAEWGKNN